MVNTHRESLEPMWFNVFPVVVFLWLSCFFFLGGGDAMACCGFPFSRGGLVEGQKQACMSRDETSCDVVPHVLFWHLLHGCHFPQQII